MVDCAKTEHQAIRSAFPHASVYLCLFHVAQIWEKKIQKDASVRFQGPSIKSNASQSKNGGRPSTAMGCLQTYLPHCYNHKQLPGEELDQQGKDA